MTDCDRIWIALFLSTLETTIVSTALVSISDALNDFELRNWIVTSYFLTYTGNPFLACYRTRLIFQRFSDHLRKIKQYIWQ